MTQAMRYGVGAAIVGALVVSATAPTLAQRGAGRGPGQVQAQAGVVCPYGFQPGSGMGMGPGAGRGGYGTGRFASQPSWWNRIQTTDPAQKAQVDYIRGLHDQLRTAQRELALLGPNGDPARVTALQQQVAQLRTEVQKAHTAAFKAGIQPLCPVGVGAGQGGWWNRVNPTDPAAKALVTRIRALHQELRDLRLQLAKAAPGSEAAAGLQARIEAKVAEVQAAHTEAWKLGDKLGFTPGLGMGPGAGRGMGAGRAMGRGMGFGRGAGLNPNCPFNAPAG